MTIAKIRTTMRKMIGAALLIAPALAVMVPVSAEAKHYVLAVASDCTPGERTMRALVDGIIDRGLGLGDTLAVYDAPRRALVMEITIPNREIFRKAVMRQNDPELAPARRKLKAFLKARCAGMAEGGHAGNLMAPQLLDELAKHRLAATGGEVQVLLVGSALHVDPRDGLDFRQGRYPSDGMLGQLSRESALGTRDRIQALRGATVHWCYTEADSDWLTDMHRQKLHRFWSRYVSSQGGRLATFGPDLLASCVDRFIGGRTEGAPVFEVDPRQAQPQMYRIGIEPPATVPEPPPTPSPASAQCRIQAPHARLALVMDTSGSMGLPTTNPDAVAAIERLWETGHHEARQRVQALIDGPGEKRMDVARAAAIDLVAGLPAGMEVGLLDFPQNCAVREVVALTASRDQMKAALQALRPVGGTPLAAALRSVRDMLGRDGASAAGQSVVVITDGRESCQGDPCAEARELHRQRPGVRVHVIDVTGASALACVAEITGGTIVTARDTAALQEAVRRAQAEITRATCE